MSKATTAIASNHLAFALSMPPLKNSPYRFRDVFGRIEQSETPLQRYSVG
jgi:hypothetical protein